MKDKLNEFLDEQDYPEEDRPTSVLDLLDLVLEVARSSVQCKTDNSGRTTHRLNGKVWKAGGYFTAKEFSSGAIDLSYTTHEGKRFALLSIGEAGIVNWGNIKDGHGIPVGPKGYVRNDNRPNDTNASHGEGSFKVSSFTYGEPIKITNVSTSTTPISGGYSLGLSDEGKMTVTWTGRMTDEGKT